MSEASEQRESDLGSSHCSADELSNATKERVRQIIGEQTDNVIEMNWEGWSGSIRVNGWELEVSIDVKKTPVVNPYDDCRNLPCP